MEKNSGFKFDLTQRMAAIERLGTSDYAVIIAQREEIAGLRAQLAEAKTVRMLTRAELSECAYPAFSSVQRKFVAVNGLTIKEES